MTTIRDRIVGLRRVPAGSLKANPKNWRTHPQSQRDALRGALAEIGYASALLARELPDGSLELIDGHLRAETTPEAVVPVLVLDVDEEEAAKLLATFDPLSSLAGADVESLGALLADIEFEEPALRSLADSLLQQVGVAAPRAAPRDEDVEVPELYQVLVECDGETQQREVFERLRADGFRCRAINL
jgi:ParB-like chromosome segregation protein Spo0J